LGYTWEKKDGFSECYFTCDNCGFVVRDFEVYSLNVHKVVEYEDKNNWYRVEAAKENGYKNQSYCFDCAVALGYISLEGERSNECKENGIIEST